MKDLYALQVQSGAGWVLDFVYDDSAIAILKRSGRGSVWPAQPFVVSGSRRMQRPR
jgi:hypothetical protein